MRRESKGSGCAPPALKRGDEAGSVLWSGGGECIKSKECQSAISSSTPICLIPDRKSPSASAASRTSGSSIDKTLSRLGLSASVLNELGDSIPFADLALGDNCDGPG